MIETYLAFYQTSVCPGKDLVNTICFGEHGTEGQGESSSEKESPSLKIKLQRKNNAQSYKTEHRNQSQILNI
jgi:hypothetical protein